MPLSRFPPWPACCVEHAGWCQAGRNSHAALAFTFSISGDGYVDGDNQCTVSGIACSGHELLGQGFSGTDACRRSFRGGEDDRQAQRCISYRDSEIGSFFTGENSRLQCPLVVISFVRDERLNLETNMAIPSDRGGCSACAEQPPRFLRQNYLLGDVHVSEITDSERSEGKIARAGSADLRGDQHARDALHQRCIEGIIDRELVHGFSFRLALGVRE